MTRHTELGIIESKKNWPRQQFFASKVEFSVVNQPKDRFSTVSSYSWQAFRELGHFSSVFHQLVKCRPFLARARSTTKYSTSWLTNFPPTGQLSQFPGEKRPLLRSWSRSEPGHFGWSRRKVWLRYPIGVVKFPCGFVNIQSFHSRKSCRLQFYFDANSRQNAVNYPWCGTRNFFAFYGNAQFQP